MEKKTMVVNGHHNRRQCCFCESECLYIEKLTCVQETEMKKHSGH